MVYRDPESGQFVADDGAGPQDRYINTDVVYWATGWDPTTGDHNGDVEQGDADAMKAITIDRPEDHLVELRGATMHIGDAAGAGDDGKVDIWLYKGHQPEMDNNWRTRMGALAEDVIFFDSHGANSNQGMVGDSNAADQFPLPYLSTGEFTVVQSGEPGENGGEVALQLWWTYREFDSQTVLEQLIQER